MIGIGVYEFLPSNIRLKTQTWNRSTRDKMFENCFPFHLFAFCEQRTHPHNSIQCIHFSFFSSLCYFVKTFYSVYRTHEHTSHHVVLLFCTRGNLILHVMRYKKIPKTALHALLIITVLTLGAIQESLNFLGGGRPTVRQEAIKVMSNT